eukprot:scaffold390_cov191-Alexandrium_tamarense.AAC.1
MWIGKAAHYLVKEIALCECDSEGKVLRRLVLVKRRKRINLCYRSNAQLHLSHQCMNKKRTTMRLPQETVNYLKAWMMSPEHISHPYPSEQEKAEIMVETGIELKQLTNWFLNNCKRYWKPREKAKLQMNYYNAFMTPPPPPLYYNVFMMPPPPPLQHPSSYNQQPIAIVTVWIMVA